MEKKTNRTKTRSRGFWTRLRKIGSDERGLSTVEYIIILVLIAVAGIGLWTEFGGVVMDKIESSRDAVEGM